VLDRPVKGVVCYLFPSVLSHGVVGASRELLIVSDRFGAVVLGVGLVDRSRHEIVVSARYNSNGALSSFLKLT
jgi:hypothetical protein